MKQQHFMFLTSRALNLVLSKINKSHSIIISLFQIYIFSFFCSKLSNECCCIYLCKRLQQLKHVNNRTLRSDHSLDHQNEKFRQQFNHYHYRIKNTILLMMMMMMMMMMTTNFEIDFCDLFLLFV